LPDAEKTAVAQSTIIETIRTLLARRGGGDVEITSESRMTADLELDSLELAELSATLEDELGRDPYSEGIVPNTVAELIAFYDD
jgi:acyl carrier protein